MPFLIRLLISGICGVCDAIGGWHLLYFRRYFIPIILGISFVFITHVWWTLFLPLPAIGTLSIGYSKDGNFGRAVCSARRRGFRGPKAESAAPARAGPAAREIAMVVKIRFLIGVSL